MKYQIALIVGLLTGVSIAVGFLFYNPLTGRASLSPLSVSDRQQMILKYSAVSEDSIVLTNDEESRSDFRSRIHPLLRYWRTGKRYPAKVLQLWEAPIRQTDALVTVLRDSRNKPTGIGIKFYLYGCVANFAFYLSFPGQYFQFLCSVHSVRYQFP